MPAMRRLGPGGGGADRPPPYRRAVRPRRTSTARSGDTRWSPRESAGRSASRTRAAQREHISNPSIVVRSRSYGSARNDREARAAYAARQQGIAVAMVARTHQLGQAVLACSRDPASATARRCRCAGSRRRERASGSPAWLVPCDRGSPPTSGRQRVELGDEARNHRRVAFDVDQHALQRVPHASSESVAHARR